jgi:Ca2+-binding RTX toxin-like protein
MSTKNLTEQFRRHDAASSALIAALRPVIDALEHRLLLTSCPPLASGVMTVNADSVADTLVIRTVSGTIEALDGGSQGSGCAFTQSSVSLVIVNAGGGNDSVTIQSSVGSIPFELNGGDGDDTLFGHTQADTLAGEGGNDRIDAGDGGASMVGGAGNDTLIGGASGDTFDGGDGNDTADYSAVIFSNLFIDLDNVADDGAGEGDNVRDNIETLFGGGGNDTIRGSDGHNRIEGRGGNDQIYGDFNSTVTSSQGSDTLDGGDGDDTIDGMDGGDQLYDSAGLDVLYGGLGSDTFYAFDEQTNPATCDTLDGGNGFDQVSGSTYGETLVSIP